MFRRSIRSVRCHILVLSSGSLLHHSSGEELLPLLLHGSGDELLGLPPDTHQHLPGLRVHVGGDQWGAQGLEYTGIFIKVCERK